MLLAGSGTAAELHSLMTRHRRLLLTLTYREIVDRFSGSVFGAAWAVAHPLALMMLYVTVFQSVFRVRFESADQFPLNVSIFMIAGYLPWMSLQAVLVGSCGAITSNANLVKQVVFPLEILPAKMTAAAMVPQLVGHAFLAVYTLVVSSSLPKTYALLPLLLLIQLVGMLGLAFFLSSVTVYVRDVREVMAVLSMAGIYVLPMFYVPTVVPKLAERLVAFNPLSHVIWVYRDALYHGEITRPLSWLVMSAGALASLLVGLSVFRRLKTYFGNAL